MLYQLTSDYEPLLRCEHYIVLSGCNRNIYNT